MASAAKGSASLVKPAFNLTKLFKADGALLKREYILLTTLTFFFYGLGTKFHHFGVHFFHPDPTKWTDADLGIPPDAED